MPRKSRTKLAAKPAAKSVKTQKQRDAADAAANETKPAAATRKRQRPAPAAKLAAKKAKEDKIEKTQTQRDEEDALKNAGGRKDVEKAPPVENLPFGTTRKEMEGHPVEQAKEEAREHGAQHLDDIMGDGTNMTATQKKAVQDQREEMELEEQAPAEPARGVEHSVGTERKEGMRTAAPESKRK